MDHPCCSLPSLPLELLEIIIKYLDGRSAVNLLITSKIFFQRLQSNSSLWRHVCRSLHLCSYEWLGDNTDYKSTQLWKSLYCRFVEINSALKRDGPQFKGQRILADLSIFDKINNNVEVQPSIYQQVIKLPSDNKKPEKKINTLRKKFISETIISYGLSEEYFVLVLSNSTTFRSSLSVWRISNEEISHSYSLSSEDLSDAWLACSEDLLVVGDTLVMMATAAQPSNYFNEGSPENSDLIYFYNLDKKILADRFSLTEGNVRFLPQILKDGGGSKLLHWKGTVLAVCPEIHSSYYQNSPELTGRIVLRFFDLHGLNDGDGVSEEKKIPVGEFVVKDAVLKQPYSYMASDQKGPNIVLAFSKQNVDHLSQQFIIISLEDPALLIQSIVTFDSESLPRIPRLLESEENERRDQCLLAVGDRAEFCLMDSSGLVTVAGASSNPR